MSRIIDAMIIGVEKAGTTSLLRYLGEHPQIATHKAMEFPFFVRDDLYENGYEAIYGRYFPSETQNKLLLAKNVGCFYWECAAQRMFTHNPDMKLIVVLRNPVARAYSAYRYAVQMGREDKRTFEDAIDSENFRLKTGEDYHKRYHAYIKRGMYAQQLEQILHLFKPSQIKIIIFEEFIKSPNIFIDELLCFLELPPAFIDVSIRHNKTTGGRNHLNALLGRRFSGLFAGIKSSIPITLRKRIAIYARYNLSRNLVPDPGINEHTKVRLEKYYKYEIRRLESITGLNLEIWKY
jgi:hypothetical protein